jgi:hypothetical protein
MWSWIYPLSLVTLSRPGVVTMNRGSVWLGICSAMEYHPVLSTPLKMIQVPSQFAIDSA